MAVAAAKRSTARKKKKTAGKIAKRTKKATAKENLSASYNRFTPGKVSKRMD